MNGLTWFQARDLAEQRHPIRRIGWTFWLLHRFNVWLISTTDPATQAETLRVALNSDFGAPEFLAKDWTDETFAGGSYPACTVATPASSPAPNSSGAAGGWTLDLDACGGSGTGGGVPANPVTGPAITPPTSFSVSVTAGSTTHNSVLTTTGSVHLPGYQSLTPDGSSCWIGTPACNFAFSLYPASALTTAEKMVFYIAPPGQSISAVPTSGNIFTTGVLSTFSGITKFGGFPCNDFFTTPTGTGGQFSSYTAYYGHYTFSIDNWDIQNKDAHTWTGATVTPAGTYTFRAINYNHTTGAIIATADASYTFPAAC